MSIGDRIRFFRTKYGMTQKTLGRILGFPARNADVRLTQYETGARTPNHELVKKIATVFNINPAALNIPEFNVTSIMQTFFELEDKYGLYVKIENDKEIVLEQETEYPTVLCESIKEWFEKRNEVENGNITRHEYDKWRYNFYVDDEESKSKQGQNKGGT